MAAGCAREPVAYFAYSPAPAMSGIDNVVYGAPAPSAPAMMAGGTYAMAPGAAPRFSGFLCSTSLCGPGAICCCNRRTGRQTPYAPPPYAAAPRRRLFTDTRRKLRRRYAPRAYTPQVYAPQAGEGGGPYTLDAGDRLRIVVFGQDGLTNSYVVGAGGYIDMPLIGSVAARGMTPDQLAGRISEKLRDGFIREPHVAVEIESYRPFFILGEVTQPGQYPYVANMTAETAVAIAGGFTPASVPQIRHSEPQLHGPSGPHDGAVDLPAASR